ncbi:hypothetical protein ACER0A_014290 [Haloimpatiens sp. FM7315]|uniref:hypothetical protein n=1 Tax=Haloimpatiens sp. FM7315 TaxID=3298609 RepID=UPI0035A3BA02
MIKNICDVNEILDYTWKSSKDDVDAIYPRIETIVNLKSYIEKYIDDKNKKVIACYDKGVLSGICLYYWITDEKYAQTKVFLITGNYSKIADEFISYIRTEFPSYEFLITCVPFNHKTANQYLKNNNFKCVDSSIVTRICNLKPPKAPRSNSVEKLTKDNFEEYARFHDKFAIPFEMYYTFEKIKKEINIFRIFVFRDADKEIQGSIFIKANKKESEIYGLFINDKYENKGIESILIDEMLNELYNEFGSVKEVIFFIDENSTFELNSALASGFKIQAKYKCYKCIL